MTPTRVAIYTRVSTVKQTEHDSLPAQRSILTDYANNVLQAVSIVYFEDAGISGTSENRPAFNEMLSRCADGEFSCILVLKLDRFSRSVKGFAKTFAFLREHNIRLIAVQENFDSFSVAGEMAATFSSVFAELEVNTLRERVVPAMKHNALIGRWNGGRVPFGYGWDKAARMFYIVESEAAIVRRIFEETAELKPARQIAADLNREKLFARAGASWSSATVIQILKNERYKGLYIYNRRDEKGGVTIRDKENWIVHPDFFPVIVPAELWENAQKALQEMAKPHVNALQHLFGGLLYCDFCGKPLNSHRSIRRAVFSDYCCRCAHEHADELLGAKSITDKKVLQFVLQYLRNFQTAIKNKKNIVWPRTLERYLTHELPGKYYVHIKNATTLFNILKGAQPRVATRRPKANKQKEISREDYLVRLAKLQETYLYGDMTPEDFTQKKKELDEKFYQKQIVEFPTPQKLADMSATVDEFLVAKVFEEPPKDLADCMDEPLFSALRDYFHRVIKRIYCNGEYITRIEFANGITHYFEYSEEDLISTYKYTPQGMLLAEKEAQWKQDKINTSKENGGDDNSD